MGHGKFEEFLLSNDTARLYDMLPYQIPRLLCNENASPNLFSRSLVLTGQRDIEIRRKQAGKDIGMKQKAIEDVDSAWLYRRVQTAFSEFRL